MSRISCPNCEKEAHEIIHAEQNVRVGWWCQACNHFHKAILRERKVA